MNFEWIEFYTKFADKLLLYKENRKELIEKVINTFETIKIKLPKLESDNNIIDIDPFTIFGLFNKGINGENRIKIINGFINEFEIKAKAPETFEGIPVLNNLSAAFYCFKDERNENDIDNIWKVFESAIKLADDSNEYNKNEFIKWYDLTIKQKGIRWNLSMGLYWVRPNNFVNLDETNRSFLENEKYMPSDFVSFIKSKTKKVPNATDYLLIIDKCKELLKADNYEYRTFSELSYNAFVELWQANQENTAANNNKKSNIAFLRWFIPIIQALKDLGGSATPADARNKIIENEKLTDEQVNEIRGKNKVNKFENDVAFARYYLVSAGYIDNSEHGVWSLTEAGKVVDMTDELAYEIFEMVQSKIRNKRKDDDIDFEEYDEESEDLFEENFDKISNEKEFYTKDNFLQEVFMTEDDYLNLVDILKSKKNIILQGAPGVGKTFISKRLAYSILGTKDENKVMMVQFHQSYSYEDFIMGYKPKESGFELKTGAFYNFCKKAEKDVNNDYFFVIDEINRGNLSKIFGELFVLIENDKREQSLQLLYSDEKFSVPKNVYIIGLMNTADRSLAMLDYALRRRFAFFDIKAGFDTEKFSDYQNNINNDKFDELIKCIKNINFEIASDETLGEGFCIGHSYFCDLNENDVEKSLSRIVEYEIIPLLKEYYFDEISKVKDYSEKLRSTIK